MEEKNRIIKYVSEKFLGNGFAKTSMDEIASDLRVSKKTIYKFFLSKDKLLVAVINLVKGQISKQMDSIIFADTNSVEKLYGVTRIIMKLGLRVNQKFFYDLKVYKPEVWTELEKFRTKMINRNFEIIFNQGKKEGYFIERPNDITITALLGILQSVMNPNFLVDHNYSFAEAGKITFDIIFASALTEKGNEVYNKLKQEIE